MTLGQVLQSWRCFPTCISSAARYSAESDRAAKTAFPLPTWQHRKTKLVQSRLDDERKSSHQNTARTLGEFTRASSETEKQATSCNRSHHSVPRGYHSGACSGA